MFRSVHRRSPRLGLSRLGLPRLGLPRLGKGPRLGAAGICLLLALSSALSAQRPRHPALASVPTVVAAADLPAGHRLVRGDLVTTRWPAALRPAGANAATADLLGRRLAGPVAAREAITAARVVGSELTRGLDHGRVAASVPLDDPHAADLVRTGSLVDLLEAPRPADLAGPSTAREGPTVSTVAQRALVLAVLPAGHDAAAELVLAVDRATAVRLTRDRAGQVFTAVVVPP